MENDLFTCCFTGYRPQKMPFAIDKADPDYIRFENRLTMIVLDLIDSGCETFISGMATGFDIIAAEIVCDLRQSINHTSIGLVCAIPFIDQAEKYPPFWKEKYNRILKECDKAVLISDKYYPGCYMRRNVYMVDNSDLVLAFYDGKPGGTKNTVDYALKKGRKVINLSNK